MLEYGNFLELKKNPPGKFTNMSKKCFFHKW